MPLTLEDEESLRSQGLLDEYMELTQETYRINQCDEYEYYSILNISIDKPLADMDESLALEKIQEMAKKAKRDLGRKVSPSAASINRFAKKLTVNGMKDLEYRLFKDATVAQQRVNEASSFCMLEEGETGYQVHFDFFRNKKEARDESKDSKDESNERKEGSTGPYWSSNSGDDFKDEDETKDSKEECKGSPEEAGSFGFNNDLDCLISQFESEQDFLIQIGFNLRDNPSFKDIWERYHVVNDILHNKLNSDLGPIDNLTARKILRMMEQYSASFNLCRNKDSNPVGHFFQHDIPATYQSLSNETGAVLQYISNESGAYYRLFQHAAQDTHGTAQDAYQFALPFLQLTAAGVYHCIKESGKLLYLLLQRRDPVAGHDVPDQPPESSPLSTS